jgi:hypothetical protein
MNFFDTTFKKNIGKYADAEFEKELLKLQEEEIDPIRR